MYESGSVVPAATVKISRQLAIRAAAVNAFCLATLRDEMWIV